MYYLQSRYYDPALGRFINADAFASTGQGLLGNNMFAYCNNNPVSYTDSGGTFSVEAEQNGDVINVTIEGEIYAGPVSVVVIIEAEYNIIEDLEIELLGYVFSFGNQGVEIILPEGTRYSYLYGDDYRTPQSMNIPLVGDWISVAASEEGLGISIEYEQGIQSYSISIYPQVPKTIDRILDLLPPAPAPGGYSNFGSYSGGVGGMNLPMRNQTLLFM